MWSKCGNVPGGLAVLVAALTRVGVPLPGVMGVPPLVAVPVLLLLVVLVALPQPATTSKSNRLTMTAYIVGSCMALRNVKHFHGAHSFLSVVC